MKNNKNKTNKDDNNKNNNDFNDGDNNDNNGSDDDNDDDNNNKNKTKQFEPYNIFLNSKIKKGNNIGKDDDGKEEKRKRKQKHGLHKCIMDDWNDLAAEEMAYKKFKKGLISKEIYDNCLFSEKKLAVDDITGQPILLHKNNSEMNDGKDDSDNDNVKELNGNMIFKFQENNSSDESDDDDDDDDDGKNNNNRNQHHKKQSEDGKKRKSLNIAFKSNKNHHLYQDKNKKMQGKQKAFMKRRHMTK